MTSPLFSINKLNLTIATIALLVVGLACGSNTPPPPQYVGVWTSGDGTLITIRADGSADYKSSNSSVSGGGAVIDEAAKTLKISIDHYFASALDATTAAATELPPSALSLTSINRR